MNTRLCRYVQPWRGRPPAVLNSWYIPVYYLPYRSRVLRCPVESGRTLSTLCNNRIILHCCYKLYPWCRCYKRPGLILLHMWYGVDFKIHVSILRLILNQICFLVVVFSFSNILFFHIDVVIIETLSCRFDKCILLTAMY